MKDKWDKTQIVFDIIAKLLVPILIPLVGIMASRAITESQVQASKQIAQSQLTKDYISMLGQAASKEDDEELINVLDSLAALEQTEIGIPPAVLGIIVRIKKETKSQKILQAASRLISSEDEKKLESYFRSQD